MEQTIFNKYGFLLFQDNINDKENIIKNIMSGLYCIAGGEVKEFKKIKDLPKNIIWFSNLKKEQSWRTGNPNIKDKDYLGISCEALISNLFIVNDKKIITKNLSIIFNQTMLVLEKFLNKQNKEISYKNEIYECVYEHFFQKSFPPNTEDVIRKKFKEAYIEKIKSPERRQGKTFTFYFEPNTFLNKILNESIPSGKWQQIENSFYKENFNSQIERIKIDKKNNIKSLIKIDELKINNNLNGKINSANIWLGKRGWQINGTVLDEMYLTENEVLFLSENATFKILEVIQNAESKVLNKFFKTKLFNEDLLLENNELKKISLIYQIIEKIFLRAFFSIGYSTNNRKKFPYTENMIWLRAKEREICFEFVKDLYEFGLSIKNFGNGEVTIFIEENKIEDKKNFVEVLIKNQVVVPYFLSLIEIDNKEELSYHLIDYYIKNKFIKNKEKINDENNTKMISQELFNFINEVAFLNELYDPINKKQERDKEIKKLFYYLQSAKFTKTDEEVKANVWFLTKIMESLKNENKINSK